jgi:hypothetical protein
MTKEKEPEPLYEYCCWVRVVDVAVCATRRPVTRFPRQGMTLAWDVPNRKITTVQAKTGAPDGVWSATDGVFGREDADTAFDFGPAFLDETAALNWLATHPDGIRWDKESLNRFLIKFGAY